MTSETWGTIFAGGTFVVITATAIAALVQLRHLRASNQLNGLLTILRMWNDPQIGQWMAKRPFGSYPKGLPRIADLDAGFGRFKTLEQRHE